MVKKLNISYDSDLIESISADFDLRTPNKKALRELIFTLDGDYDTNIMQVLNLATGVGKTYLMAAFIEYLRRQGIGNVVIVTPGKVVQSKTVQNFVPGNDKYIEGTSSTRYCYTSRLFCMEVSYKWNSKTFLWSRSACFSVYFKYSAINCT